MFGGTSTSSKQVCEILYDKHWNIDLNTVMKDQFQYLLDYQQKDLFKLLGKFDFFNGTLGTCKTDPVDFELKKKPNQYGFDHIQ